MTKNKKTISPQITDDLTEKILREVHSLYNDPSAVNPSLGRTGLEKMSHEVSIKSSGHEDVFMPRRRVTVMIVGNHSAGKSSFINWYVGAKVLKASVAVESTGFTIVREGSRSAELTGESALVDNLHLRAATARLKEGPNRKAFLDSLALVTVPSRSKNFSNVDLIDTPGLVDGNLSYGYDVNAAIMELASMCDLILIFLDPIGQALVSRTMNVVASLNEKHADKVKYYLTKIDTVDTTGDRMKLMAQLSSQLSGRLRITHGLEIPCLAVPVGKDAGLGSTEGRAHAGLGSMKDDDANALAELCELIDRTVTSRVQKNLDTAAKHTDALLARIDEVLVEEGKKGKSRDGLFTWLVLLWPFYLILGLLGFCDLLSAMDEGGLVPQAVLAAPIYTGYMDRTKPSLTMARSMMGALGAHNLQHRSASFLCAFLLVSALSALLRCRVRGLGLRTADGVAQLRVHSSRVEAMASRMSELRKEMVRAAEVPDYVQR